MLWPRLTPSAVSWTLHVSFREVHGGFIVYSGVSGRGTRLKRRSWCLLDVGAVARMHLCVQGVGVEGWSAAER
eukprot:5834429-Prymnesium_polylepis.2